MPAPGTFACPPRPALNSKSKPICFGDFADEDPACTKSIHPPRARPNGSQFQPFDRLHNDATWTYAQPAWPIDRISNQNPPTSLHHADVRVIDCIHAFPLVESQGTNGQSRPWPSGRLWSSGHVRAGGTCTETVYLHGACIRPCLRVLDQ